MTEEKLRRDALAIFNAALRAVDPEQAVYDHVRLSNNTLHVGDSTYDLGAYENIYVIGMGKAAASMAKALESLLGKRLTGGIVSVKYGHTRELEKIKINEAGHPLPDEAGLAASKEIIELAKSAGEKDLVLCVISGGGSALLPLPAEGLTLGDKQSVTDSLLQCGATIHELNAIRKQISMVKGGRLVTIAYPATLVSLILSDVIGDDLDVIASGPTVPDTHSFEDCRDIIDKYELKTKIPIDVYEYIEEGCKGKRQPTPKEDHPAFAKTHNHVVGSNIIAALAAKDKARELGYNAILLSTYIHGETEEVAKVHTAIAKEIKASGNPVAKPACVISGGETTVTIEGEGKGGRNQEFVLAAAIDITGLENVVVLSGGTDGNDGPTDAAGAVADGGTISRAAKIGLDPAQVLHHNDSYNFFKPLDDLIITGPTNTNVMDIRLVLVGA